MMKSEALQTKRRSLNNFAILKWLFSSIIRDPLIVGYCLLVIPIISITIYYVQYMSQRDFIDYSMDGMDTSVYYRLTTIAATNIFSLTPLVFIVLPMFTNKLRRCSFSNKIKFWNFQTTFAVCLFFYFFVIITFSLLFSLCSMLAIEPKIFSDISSTVLTINYLGYFVVMVLGALFFASCSLLIGFATKSIFEAAFVGVILLLIYLIDSGFVLFFVRLRSVKILNICSYFSPFTYISCLSQAGIASAHYPTFTNGNIFDPFHDYQFAVMGGDISPGENIIFHTYDIWLGWIMPVSLTIGSNVASFIIVNKRQTLWIND